VACLDQVQAEGLDESALADAWDAGDADAQGVARVRHQCVEQRVGLAPMVCAR
jgi:hypothetical protein